MQIGSKRDLAELLGISERRITDLITAGILPKRGPNGFDLVASVQGYIAFLKSEPGTLKAERTRVTKLKADLLELEFRQKKGELILKDVADRCVFASSRATRTNLHNIAPRVAGVLAAEKDQHKIFELLTRELDLALEDLCNENLDAQEINSPKPH
jgi:phage terminase Nu1 subunit (DNA packaging protein)